MAYALQKTFETFGKIIKRYNTIETHRAAMDVIMSEWVTLLNNTAGERAMLNQGIYQDTADQIQYEDQKDANKTLAEYWLQNEIATDLAVSDYTDNDECLDALSDQMTSDGDSVLENTVAASAPAADPDNTGNGTCAIGATTQFIHHNRYFTLECYNADTVGAELWTVVCNDDDDVGTATTGVAFTSTKYGFTLTITAGGVNFAVGDRFTFTTTITVQSKFQTFFVEQFDTALPSVPAANTVNEAWAT